MNRIILAVILLSSTTVFASGYGRFGGSASNAVARAQQNQHQGQIQGQKQDARGGNAVIGGNKVPNQAPSFGFGAMFPTAPCQATLGAGFSFMFGGGAAAGSRTLAECEKRETIRSGVDMIRNAPTPEYAAEQATANREVFCMTEYGGKTGMCPKTTTTEN